MVMDNVDFTNFSNLDIRVGNVLKVESFEKAKKPAYKLWVDFGTELGVLKSSAQITELYSMQSLIGSQILAVVNFHPRQIADFMSECLVLGVYSDEGVILLRPDKHCEKGAKLG
jgi:tRNA-binding protein